MNYTNPVCTTQFNFQRLLSVLLLPMLTAAFLMLALPVAQAGGKQAVIMQVSENDPMAWNLALNIARNLPQEFGKDNVEIEIVAFGPGLMMFEADSDFDKRLSEAAKAGVALRACGKTMKAYKLTKKDLHPGVVMVPGGVVEIIAKTRDGWTYLRP